MTKPSVNLLMVESDEAFARCLQQYVEKKTGCRMGVLSGMPWTDLLDACASCDLVLLSSDLPAPGSLRLVQQVRALHPTVLVVYMLRAYVSREMEAAYAAGADEVVCKYGAGDECRLRICHWVEKAVHATDLAGRLLLGDESTFNAELQLLTVCGEAFRLPRLEARILETLARRAGRLVPHEDLLTCSGTGWEVNANSKDRSISHLRKYLAKDASVKIESVRPAGYVLKVFRNQK